MTLSEVMAHHQTMVKEDFPSLPKPAVCRTPDNAYARQTGQLPQQA